MIKLTCKDGHEVEMFPDKCITEAMGIGVYFDWECPRCEKDEYNGVLFRNEQLKNAVIIG